MTPSICIDAVLEGKTIREALKAVNACQFSAFEFWCWWEKDLEELVAEKDRLGLTVAACCTKFISLVDPQRRADYLAGLDESIAAAKTIGCSTLISQVGDFVEGQSRAQQHQSIVDGLKMAAPMLMDANQILVIEPLNEKVDHAGYYLVHSDEAFEIVREVDCPNIKVVFDIYHQQISEGNLIPNITANIDLIGHFHAAGHPGRHELSRGEINYPEIFRAIEATNFDGYIGMEYWPVNEAETGLREIAGLFGLGQ